MAPIAGIQGFGNTLGMASNDGGSGTVGDIISFGAGGTDRPSITTDSSGNFYIVVTADQRYFGGEGAGTAVSPLDIMVIKFNSAFEVQWKKLIGTPHTVPLTNDASGQDYVGDSAGGKFGIATDDTHLWITFQERLGSYSFKIHVVKYNVSDGSVVWKKSIESVDDGILSGGLGIDSSGNAYVGYSHDDQFIMKLNSSGTKQWERQLGGSQQDNIYHMVVDSSGNVYTCGLHNRFPASGNLVDRPFYDWQWGIAKYNSSGTLQWYRAFGDSNYSGSGSSNPHDRAFAMCLDSSGNVYVTGYFSSGDAHGIVKYNSSGTMQWYRNYVNDLYPNDGANGRAVCVDADDNVYVTGSTENFFQSSVQSVGVIMKWNSSGTLQYQQYLDFGFGSSGTGTVWDSIIQDNQIYVVGDNAGVLTIARLPTNDSQMPGFQQDATFDLCYFSVDYFGPHRPITSGSWSGYYIGNRGYNDGVYDVATETVNSDARNWMMFKPFVADSTTLTDAAALVTVSGISTNNGTVGVSTAIANDVEIKSRQVDILFELDARNSSSWPGSGSTWSDLTDNNRDFTLSGATNGSDAVSFDGTDDYGEIAHADWMPHSTEPLYVEAYITNLVLPGPGQFTAVLSKSNSSGTIQWGVGFYTTPGSSNNEYRMVFVATGTNNSLGTASQTPIYYTFPDPNAITTGYHHFGWAYEGNSFFKGGMALYLDGVQVGFWEGDLNQPGGTNYRLGDEDTSADLRIADSEAGAFIDNHLDGDIRVLRCYTEKIGPRFNIQNWMNCIEEVKVFKYQIPN